MENWLQFLAKFETKLGFLDCIFIHLKKEFNNQSASCSKIRKTWAPPQKTANICRILDISLEQLCRARKMMKVALHKFKYSFRTFILIQLRASYLKWHIHCFLRTELICDGYNKCQRMTRRPLWRLGSRLYRWTYSKQSSDTVTASVLCLLRDFKPCNCSFHF